MYISAFFHELGHLIVIKGLKINIEKIKIMPYGIVIKTKMIKNPTHKILVSIAGPTVNFFIAVIFSFFDKYMFFTVCNIVVFALNILPSFPLDGGSALMAYLSKRRGYINAFKMVIRFTKIIGITVTFLGMIVLIITKYNISLLIIGMFLLYNIIYEKQNIIQVKKNLLCNEFFDKRKTFKIKKLGAGENVKLINFVSEFSYDYVIEISVYNDDFKKIGEISQDMIIDALTKYSSSITCGKLLERIKTNDK